MLGVLLEQKRQRLAKLIESGADLEKERKTMDLLSLMLLANQTVDDEEKQLLSDKELIDNCNIFFIAGHDTTSTSLTAVLYYLSLNPECQEKARKEVLEVLGPDGNMQQEISMPYLEACIREALRLTPPVRQLPRRVFTEDTKVDGYKIKKGDTCGVDIYALHYSGKYWKDSLKYNPERFLSGPQETPYAWLAFGGGSRICLGMAFSLMEQKVVLSRILQRYQWDLPKDSVHKDGLVTKNGGGLIDPASMPMRFIKI